MTEALVVCSHITLTAFVLNIIPMLLLNFRDSKDMIRLGSFDFFLATS